MLTRRFAVFVLCCGLPLFSASPDASVRSLPGVARQAQLPQPASTGVRMGRVTAAGAVAGYGAFASVTRFLPGQTVWLYAETLGTVKDGKVDLVFTFAVKAPDGGSVFDVKVEFSEAAKTSNWGAWKSLSSRRMRVPAPTPSASRCRTGRPGSAGPLTGSFLVASGATALPADIRGEDWPDLQAELSSPLTPVMEEAVALLRLKRFDEAVRAFRKALDQEPESTLGDHGLAKAYEGSAFKNVIETCEKAITGAKEPRAQAYMLNMKGVALSSRANRKQPPDKQDLVLAEQAYRAALDLNPALHLTRYNLGIMHVKAGEDAEGVELLRVVRRRGAEGPLRFEREALHR